MTELIDFLKGFNIQNLMGMAVICWYFTHDLKSQIEKLDNDLNNKIDQQSKRTDKLYEMFIDLLKSKSQESLK